MNYLHYWKAAIHPVSGDLGLVYADSSVLRARRTGGVELAGSLERHEDAVALDWVGEDLEAVTYSDSEFRVVAFHGTTRLVLV